MTDNKPTVEEYPELGPAKLPTKCDKRPALKLNPELGPAQLSTSCDKKPVWESNTELGPTKPPEIDEFYVQRKVQKSGPIDAKEQLIRSKKTANIQEGISGQKNDRFSRDNQTIGDHFRSLGDPSKSAKISNSSDDLLTFFDRQKTGSNPRLVSDHVVRLQTLSSGPGSFAEIEQKLTESLPTRAGLVSRRIRNIRKLIEGRDLSLSPSEKRKIDKIEDPQDQKKLRLGNGL